MCNLGRSLLTLPLAALAVPLKLDGATCADPPRTLPEYCCQGIIPNPNFIDTCECNPGWTHKECICKAYTTTLPCHHCMVHLPGTNRWTKSFSEEELYTNCADCVTECKADLAKGDCSDFMDEIWKSKFPVAEPVQVMCTNAYLKGQVTKEDYPLELKRALYKAPRFNADDDYHQPSDWDVAGVGAKR